MSLVSIGGQNATSGDLFWPDYGQWLAHVRTDSDTLLSGEVTIAIGDLSMTGTIIPGKSGISASVGHYAVKGGIAWDTVIAKRAYQTDAASGVRLRTVIRDIAQDARVLLSSIDFPPDLRVGSAWERRPGEARTAFDVLRDIGLAPTWYITPAGRTVFGTRPTGNISEPARIKKRSLELGIKYIRVDSYAPWVPGMSFEGDRISAVCIRWTDEDAILELHQ